MPSIVHRLNLSRRRSRRLVESLHRAGVLLYDLPAFDARQYAWTTVSVLSFLYLIVFTAYTLRAPTDRGGGFMKKIAGLKTLLSAFMCLVVLLATACKRRHLRALVGHVERGFYAYAYADEPRFGRVRRASTTAPPSGTRLTAYGCECYFVGIYGAAVLAHPIHLLFDRDLLRSSTRMLIQTWVPFDGNTMLSFCLAQVTLFAVTLPVALTIAGNVRFMLHVGLEFGDQFARLSCALRTLAERVAAPAKRTESTTNRLRTAAGQCECDNAPFSRTQIAVVQTRLIECVRHHQAIRIAFNHFAKWFNLTYSIVLVHSVLTLAMMLYGALLNFKNVGVSVKYASVLLMYTGQVFMHCHIGEQMNYMNESMVKILYSIPWYRLPPENRKILYIFMCQIQQRPFRLLGLKIYPASLKVFSSIMKLSYSYLNLLRTYGSSFRRSI